MSTNISRKGPRAGAMAPRIRRQPRTLLGVESLAGFVARRLQGEQQRAVVLGQSRPPAAPFPLHRLAGAITRQLGCNYGKVAFLAVLREIERHLLRSKAKRAV